MKILLNTLYVMTQESYIHLDNETVRIRVGNETKMRVPLHHLGGIVTIGNVLMSPFLIERCVEQNKSIVMLDRHGQFICRMVGKTTGNILLRQAQYSMAKDSEKVLMFVKNIVAAKIKNSRMLLMRAARERANRSDQEALRTAAAHLLRILSFLTNAQTLDEVRGFEGEAARYYFEVFSLMQTEPVREIFAFSGRSRRPPMDRINALLSFLYTLLINDCVSALEGVGLDPQMGFLHAVRPGRPALALDLVEEFRTGIADRLALALINRRQITADDFVVRPGGSVWLNDQGRKSVISAYQERKQESIKHPLLKEKAMIGLLPHLQARLMARYLRGDIDQYLPMVFE